MARDDYNYIVFKILTYLYAVLKRKQSFDETVFWVERCTIFRRSFNIIWNDWLPAYLAYGVPYDLFWHLTPNKLDSFKKAYDLRRKIENEKAWIMGNYVLHAVSTAIDNCLQGKKSKAKYLDKPFLHDYLMDEKEMSQEEKDRIEIEKMLMAEKQWQMRHSMSNLPKTIIK